MNEGNRHGLHIRARWRRMHTLTKRHLDRRGIDLKSAPIVCASVDGQEQYWDGYRPDRIDALRGAA